MRRRREIKRRRQRSTEMWVESSPTHMNSELVYVMLFCSCNCISLSLIVSAFHLIVPALREFL